MRKEIFLAVFQAWRKIDTELCELATRGLRVWIFVSPRAKVETEKHKHSEGMANMLMKFNFALKDFEICRGNKEDNHNGWSIRQFSHSNQ